MGQRNGFDQVFVQVQRAGDGAAEAADFVGHLAVGEVACTGLHGANRLASNSLLEAVVLAHDGAVAAHDEIIAKRGQAMALPAWIDGSAGDPDERVVLTHNWDESGYGEGRNFGHLAYSVSNIYETCQRLMEGGVTINRPPRDGRMAFVRSPDNISVELLQDGDALPLAEPWASMPNIGHW